MPLSDEAYRQDLFFLGLRLKDIRAQFGCTQAQFAEHFSLSITHLCNIEGGRREPSLRLLMDIAGDLGVSLDYIVLGRTNAPGDSALIFRSDEELAASFLCEGDGPEA